MNGTPMREIERLARKAGRVLIVTADPEGWPHAATANSVRTIPERVLVVTGWFCPVTEANLARNPRAAVIVWDETSGDGFQAIGWREREDEIAAMNGYAPGLEDSGFPQIERELRLRINRILTFRHTRHTDEERMPT